DLARAVLHVRGADDVEAGLVDDPLAELGVRALEPHDERHLEAHLLDGRDDAVRDRVALHDAAEDVDEDPPDVWVTSDDLECRRDVLLGGAAADIEEVRRLAADLRDRVHRRYGQTGAVDETAVVAVELDE